MKRKAILTRREGTFCSARHRRCSCCTPESNASAILCNGYTISCAALTRVYCHCKRTCSGRSALYKPGLDTAVQARASIERTQDGRLLRDAAMAVKPICVSLGRLERTVTEQRTPSSCAASSRTCVLAPGCTTCHLYAEITTGLALSARGCTRRTVRSR